MTDEYSTAEIGLFLEMLHQEMDDHYLNFKMGLTSEMFIKLVRTYKDLLDIELSRKALYPYLECARSLEQVLESVVSHVSEKSMMLSPPMMFGINFPRLYNDGDIFGRVSIVPEKFAMYLSKDEVEYFIEALNGSLSHVRSIAGRFEQACDDAFGEIKLMDISSPNSSPLESCLFIVPTLDIPNGYGYFLVSLEQSEERIDACFSYANPSEEQEIDYSRGAIFHCSNTSRYPLYDTVLPVLKIKYFDILSENVGIVQGNFLNLAGLKWHKA